MKRLLLILILVIVVISACKKENPYQKQTKETVNDYFPLKVGNYWIYEYYQCDSGEINCEGQGIDTSFVIKDTLINGKNFFKVSGGYFIWKDPTYYRDSSDYIVNEQGKIIFTHNDTTDTFNHVVINSGTEDSIFYWYHQLLPDKLNINVDAGKFECLNFQSLFFRKEDGYNTEYTSDNCYAKNTGLVKQTTFFASSFDVIKRDLVGFHIVPEGIIEP